MLVRKARLILLGLPTENSRRPPLVSGIKVAIDHAANGELRNLAEYGDGYALRRTLVEERGLGGKHPRRGRVVHSLRRRKLHLLLAGELAILLQHPVLGPLLRDLIGLTDAEQFPDHLVQGVVPALLREGFARKDLGLTVLPLHQPQPVELLNLFLGEAELFNILVAETGHMLLAVPHLATGHEDVSLIGRGLLVSLLLLVNEVLEDLLSVVVHVLKDAVL